MANSPAMRPTFTTGGRRQGQDHRHLQEDAEEIADIVGGADPLLGEALGAIAALEQESLACGDAPERLLELARLACKNQRRKARELLLDRGQAAGSS